MTDRRLNESAIGLAGRLSHIPFGTDRAEDCGWHSSRNFTRNAPVFTALGPCRTWIPAEADHITDSPPPSGTAWEQSRRQRRWLLKNHPEASLGNQLLHELFPAESSPFGPQQDRSWQSCFFSFGELTDTSLVRASGAPLVVTVTGGANNILRLAKLNQEKWAWSREYNVAVRLAEVSMEKPALWIDEDVGPIRRVKCIVDLKRYNPTRWLAVQRDSGTTIFQPEYRKMPPASSVEKDASRIAPNPLFHLWKEQTGGNTHSDVAFNPGTRSNPPQLAIVDERGFWSVWDVPYTRLKPSADQTPNLRMCGHIERGILEQLPRRDPSDMQWHRLLWVGRSEDSSDILGNLSLDADTDELGSQVTFPPLQRSSLVLVYNSRQVKLLDLTTGFYLPNLAFVRQNSPDRVLDIQSTHDPQYFCVLTTSKLFIVRVYSKPGLEWDKPEKVWSVLFSTPHFRSSLDQSLKLAITQGAKSDQGASLVFLYSSANPWIDLFYVELSTKDPNAVKCQPNVVGLGSLQNTTLNTAIRTLCISPIPIIVKDPECLANTELGLAEKRIRLYQVAALKSDMSLVSALCVSSLSSSVKVSPPCQKVGRRSKAEQQRRKHMRHLSSSFVVPDDSTLPGEATSSVAHRCIKMLYEHVSRISINLDTYHLVGPSGREVFGYNPFDAVHFHVEEAVKSGRVPVRTLFQVIPNMNEASRASLPAVDWDAEIERLNNVHSSATVVKFDLLRSRLGLPVSASLQEAYSKLLDIVNSSLHFRCRDDADEDNAVAISQEIAYDLYLSIYGIGYRNPSNDEPRAAADEDALLNSQTETLPSSPPSLPSPASTPTLSQWSNLEAVEEEDPAMALLRAYTGTGKFVPEKQSELLDKWRLGAEPSDYVFDLDRSANADAGRQRTAKQLAREDRKRHRAETLLHISQEPELPATQPAPDTSFFSSQSRGFSSQRQVIRSDPLGTMSQPSVGLFGRRPNKKVKKRKGGF